MQTPTANHLLTPVNRGHAFTTRVFPAVFIAMLFLVPCPLQAGVVRLGNPFIPAGATNFSIFALQGIDAGTPLGDTGVSPQVNLNFEFPAVLGVTIDQGGGKLKDFGIGLYEGTAKQTQSTGLEILFNQPIFADSATATVLDFDIQAGKDTFFKPEKVEPSIAFLGPGNTILGTALPIDIFPNLVPTLGGAKGDTWIINFPGLLNTIGLAGNTPINGFILFADQTGGERPSSDPYLLVSVGNGVVPEAPTYVLVCVGATLAFFVRMRLKRKALR
jgi:hypothetical protein